MIKAVFLVLLSALNYPSQSSFDEITNLYFHHKLSSIDTSAVPENMESFALGVIEEINGNLQTALKHYENSLSQFPKNTYLTYRISFLLMKMGKFREARIKLLKFYKNGKDDFYISFPLAVAISKDNPDMALKILNHINEDDLSSSQKFSIAVQRFIIKGTIGTDKESLKDEYEEIIEEFPEEALKSDLWIYAVEFGVEISPFDFLKKFQDLTPDDRKYIESKIKKMEMREYTLTYTVPSFALTNAVYYLKPTLPKVKEPLTPPEFDVSGDREFKEISSYLLKINGKEWWVVVFAKRKWLFEPVMGFWRNFYTNPVVSVSDVYTNTNTLNLTNFSFVSDVFLSPSGDSLIVTGGKFPDRFCTARVSLPSLELTKFDEIKLKRHRIVVHIGEKDVRVEN